MRFFSIIIILLISILVNNLSFGQDKFVQKIEKQLIKDSVYYQRNAKRTIRKCLFKESVGFNIFNINDFFKDTELLIIPRFKIAYKSELDYTNLSTILKHLNYKKNKKFHGIEIYKEDTIVGYYASDGLGPGGVLLDKDVNMSEKSKERMKKLKNTGAKIFFIQGGFLSALFLVKDSRLMVFDHETDKFYEPQEYLNEFYTNERLHKNIKYVAELKY